MLNFYEFYMLMEQQQTYLFQAGHRELYHGSNSGPNDSIAKSFISKGAQSGTGSDGDFQQAKSSISQGTGFYMWSDAASAKNHSIKEAGEGGSETKMGGSPMIVVVESVLEPEEWDLDYETNYHTVLKWLHSNWDTVKDDLGEVLNLDKSKAITRGGGKYATGEEVPIRQGMQLAPKNNPSWTTRSYLSLAQDSKESSVGIGDKMGTVMNALSTGKNNALMHKFEERFFANMPNGVAVKYAGANPLPVKRIEILKNGQWVNFYQAQPQEQPTEVPQQQAQQQQAQQQQAPQQQIQQQQALPRMTPARTMLQPRPVQQR